MSFQHIAKPSLQPRCSIVALVISRLQPFDESGEDRIRRTESEVCVLDEGYNEICSVCLGYGQDFGTLIEYLGRLQDENDGAHAKDKRERRRGDGYAPPCCLCLTVVASHAGSPRVLGQRV